MTPQRYQQIKRIFAEACGRPAGERGAYLDQACVGDAELRAEIDSLLAHDEKSLPLKPGVSAADMLGLVRLDAGAADDPPSGPGPAPAREPVPARIGHYRIVRKIGEGGMGTVYEAEQDNPRRTVALKVIRPGIASEQVLRRFKLEAHVLGRLQHPGIAQIHEAGMADMHLPDGSVLEQPFFAMELVHGRPLGEFVRRNNLGIRQRLDLLVKVCDAVEHAHQHGVIHRDLKPGNILVDESGQPKILDFGVARITDADVQMTTLRTDVGQLIGTVAYMSPEQIAGDWRALDIRSDVYALGVLIFQGLTDRLPYDVADRTIPEAARTIAEEEPTPLSTVNRVFRGDLTTIVAKALEKNPHRRYQSAADLAADIRRYLAEQPISARPATTLYQLGKFARRNPALVGGVLVAFLALLIGVVGTTSQAIRATRERDAAIAARSEAQRQADNATAANDFVREVLSLASPAKAAGRHITIYEAVDMAARNINAFTAGRPDSEAALRVALGRTYHSLGHFDIAVEQLRLALEIQRRERGAEHPHALVTQRYLAGALSDSGRTKEAIDLLRTGSELQRAVLGETHPDTLDSFNALAWILFTDGNAAQAEPLFRKVLDAASVHDGAEGATTLTAMSNLAATLIAQGKLTGAESLATQGAEGLARSLGTRHPTTLYARSIHGWYLYTVGRYAEAEPLFRSIVEDATDVLGPEHPYRLYWVGSLGWCLLKRGQLDEAESLFTQALTTQRRVLGEGHAYILESSEGLARTLIARQDYADGERLALDSYNAAAKRFGHAHRLTVAAAAVLADLYDASGDRERASEWRAKPPTDSRANDDS